MVNYEKTMYENYAPCHFSHVNSQVNPSIISRNSNMFAMCSMLKIMRCNNHVDL
jgi:hypothetical protein